MQRIGWVDALQKAVIAAQKLYELDAKIRKEKYHEPFDGGAFLSITEFDAGEAMNVHPSSCSFTVDRRLVPGETPESVKKEIREEPNLRQGVLENRERGLIYEKEQRLECLWEGMLVLERISVKEKSSA